MGQNEKAINAFQKSLKLEPNNGKIKAWINYLKK